MYFGHLWVKNAWTTAATIYQSYFGQKDWKFVEIPVILLIHHLVGRLVSGLSWLLDGLFWENGVKAAAVSGGLGTGFLRCVSGIGLTLGVPIGIEDGGRGGGVVVLPLLHCLTL